MNTELLSHINWLAVVAAGVAYFAIGAAWYSKVLFANAWVKHTGVNMNDPNAKKGAAQTMLFSLVLMIIASAGLAVIMARIDYVVWSTGVKVGLLAGICFSATAICISYLYEKRPFALHFINAGYSIVGTLVAAIIIAVWR